MEFITPQSEGLLQPTPGTSVGSPLVGNSPTICQAGIDSLSVEGSPECPPPVPSVNRAPFSGDTRCGGPQTPEGKAASRKNALKHGLSASKLLPDILEVDLVQEHYEALREEWQPATPTQEFLVRDTARHQAALERAEQIELAVLHCADGVERVQIQPLVLEHAPPGFDQKIRIRDFGASQNATKQPRMDEFIDNPVEVLSATVNQHRGRTILQALHGDEQDFGGGARIEGGRDLPSQDAAREVVDHRVQIAMTLSWFRLRAGQSPVTVLPELAG
jgi:hypothetical protein